MTYCFKCPECGYWVETPVREPAPACASDKHRGEVSMRRDYRAEGVAPQVLQLKREREAGGRRAVRDLFLPTQKDFESPSDPDGSKGIREWADGMKPKAGNKRPLWPDMPKKVF